MTENRPAEVRPVTPLLACEHASDEGAALLTSAPSHPRDGRGVVGSPKPTGATSSVCKECGHPVPPACKDCGSRLGPEYHELGGTYLDQIKLFFRDCPNHGQRLVRSVNAWR